MNPDAKNYIAGHRGIVGSGLMRRLITPSPSRVRASSPAPTPNSTSWVYGSVAKQTDTAKSDIDIMLIGENLLPGDILERLVPLEAQLGRKINPGCYQAMDYHE